MLQLTTHQLVVVVVEATTVTMSRSLQAGQQRGLPLGVVPHNSGNATYGSPYAIPASCDNEVVTFGHLDTTSNPGMSYQINNQFKFYSSVDIHFCLLRIIS